MTTEVGIGTKITLVGIYVKWATPTFARFDTLTPHPLQPRTSIGSCFTSPPVACSRSCNCWRPPISNRGGELQRAQPASRGEIALRLHGATLASWCEPQCEADHTSS